MNEPYKTRAHSNQKSCSFLSDTAKGFTYRAMSSSGCSHDTLSLRLITWLILSRSGAGKESSAPRSPPLLEEGMWLPRGEEFITLVSSCCCCCWCCPFGVSEKQRNREGWKALSKEGASFFPGRRWREKLSSCLWATIEGRRAPPTHFKLLPGEALGSLLIVSSTYLPP